MGLDQKVSRVHRDIVAGIGFRHAAQPGAIAALVRQALAAVGLPEARLRLVATASDRAGDDAFREAAAILGIGRLGLAPDALRAVDARVITRSARIAATRGIGSLAEAAALAGAGAGARLILPRIAQATVTCALAQIPKEP